MSPMANIETLRERQREADVHRTATMRELPNPPRHLCACGTTCWAVCDGPFLLFRCPTCGHTWSVWAKDVAGSIAYRSL